MSVRCPKCRKRAMHRVEKLVQLGRGRCVWCGVALRPRLSLAPMFVAFVAAGLTAEAIVGPASGIVGTLLVMTVVGFATVGVALWAPFERDG